LARERLTEDKESKKKPGRIAEPKPTFRERMAARRKEAQTPEATKERMARRKKLARNLFSRKPYTEPAKEILGRAKQGFEQTLQESTERSRKKFADRREAEQKEKEEWAKTRDRRSLEFQRKEQEKRNEQEAREQEKARKKRDKQLAREQKRALRQMASQSGVGGRSVGETDEQYFQRIKQAYQKKQTQQKTPKVPKGPTGPPPSTTQTNREPGQISSTPSKKGLEAQRRLNEQTEQTTQALKDATNKLNKSVIKMNNDKYNAEQKSEPNRNFTPFVPLEKKRVMPEKQNKIPGVIQHSRPKRKKTENKW
jgi:hypothetical protein